jgi:phosphopantothenoylcysteine decarboxylase/phosphopantothenate--cysteine ligase
MAAAVCDWRPKRRLAGKWRKKDGGAQEARLDLVRNPDVLATLAGRKQGRLVVGFALETADGLRRARAKLERKHLDFIVLNDASALNATRASVIILAADGTRRRLAERSKERIAEALVELLPRARA